MIAANLMAACLGILLNFVPPRRDPQARGLPRDQVPGGGHHQQQQQQAAPRVADLAGGLRGQQHQQQQQPVLKTFWALSFSLRLIPLVPGMEETSSMILM